MKADDPRARTQRRGSMDHGNLQSRLSTVNRRMDKKSGRVIRTFDTKDPAKRAAARFADSSKDKVVFERKNGSVQQDRVFDNPR